MNEVRIDALLPQEMATRVEYLGIRKAEMPFLKMFMLAVLAGAFISLGAIFATTVSAGSIAITASGGETSFTAGLPYGFNRLLVGLAFYGLSGRTKEKLLQNGDFDRLSHH